jgi:hypothetical protein
MAGSFQSDGIRSATDLARQIIALSTGSTAFTITFLDRFTKGSGGALHVPPWLYAAWLLFGLTIAFALWTLMAATGTLEAFDRKANGWPLTPAQEQVVAGASQNLRLPGLLMIAAFFLAVVAMIGTGLTL